MSAFLSASVHVTGEQSRVRVAVNDGERSSEQAGYLFVGIDNLECVLYLSPAGAVALVEALQPHVAELLTARSIAALTEPVLA